MRGLHFDYLLSSTVLRAAANATGRSTAKVDAKAIVAKANEAGKVGPEPLTPTDAALAATLESIQRDGREYETNGTARVAKAVLAYLEEKQRLAGNVAITTDLPTLRRHCFELVHYRTRDDQKQDISSPAFETCVRRGIEAALLMHNNVKGIHICTPAEDKELAGQIVAPANVLVPKISVPLPGTSGKSIETDNPASFLVPVTVRALETTFRKEFPGIKSSRAANAGKAKPAKTREDLKAISLSVLMLEVAARLKGMSKIEGTERDVAAELLLALDPLMEADGAGTKSRVAA